MARLPSSRHAVHRSLRIPDLREGDDSPLRISHHHGLPATCRSRRLPTQRLRPCGLNDIFQTRSQQCTDILSSQLPGPCHDVPAAWLAPHGKTHVNFCDAVVLRHFTARLGSEAVRVGQALGYRLEEIHHIDPEIVARAGEGDLEAKAEYDAHRLAEAQKPGGGAHRPSMGQDMVKGRRTEIEFLNGLIADKGKEVGVSTPANAALTHIVKRVEKGDLQPDKRHILELRLN